MPSTREFRADFRKGRTGRGMRVRQDTEAYQASLKDALNMMVLPNGVQSAVADPRRGGAAVGVGEVRRVVQ